MDGRKKKVSKGWFDSLVQPPSSSAEREWSRGWPTGFLSPLSGLGTSNICSARLKAAKTVDKTLRRVSSDRQPV